MYRSVARSNLSSCVRNWSIEDVADVAFNWSISFIRSSNFELKSRSSDSMISKLSAVNCTGGGGAFSIDNCF